MYVEIVKSDSAGVTGRLRAAADLNAFSVQVGADCTDEMVAAWLAQSGAGHIDGDEVAVNVQWLRRCTADRDPQWQDGFLGMLDYASRKGWLDEERTVVMAHVERRSPR